MTCHHCVYFCGCVWSLCIFLWVCLNDNFGTSSYFLIGWYAPCRVMQHHNGFTIVCSDSFVIFHCRVMVSTFCLYYINIRCHIFPLDIVQIVWGLMLIFKPEALIFFCCFLFMWLWGFTFPEHVYLCTFYLYPCFW